MDKSEIKIKFREHIAPNIKLMLLIVLLGIAFYLLKVSPLKNLLNNFELLRAEISSAGSAGPLIFIIIGGVLTAIGFPRLALSSLAGFIYGFCRTHT